MKRTLLVLFLGLTVGAAAHFIYFGLHQPKGDSLDNQLAWMKSELKLSDAQYDRIKELHQASSPRLRALASQVAQMQAEFTAFETARRDTDRVDFVEFARFVETRRRINRECLDSTRQLVLASAQVMTPQQRERYLGLMAEVEPRAAQLLN